MNTKAKTMGILALGCALFATSGALAVEQFKKISGPQIRAKCSGMEMTDEVHWRDAYVREGRFRRHSMGRTRIGKWLVRRMNFALTSDLAPTAVAMRCGSQGTRLS